MRISFDRTYTSPDVTKAVEGVLAAGLIVERVEVRPDGTATVFPKIDAQSQSGRGRGKPLGLLAEKKPAAASAPPKGVHTVRKKLATGKIALYHYAWRGGPRLAGSPGDTAFMRSYEEAYKAHRASLGAPSTLAYLTDRYRDSPEFARLAERTRKDYGALLRQIDEVFGDLPLAQVGDRFARVGFLDWRDAIGGLSPRQADYAWSVLARVFSWGVWRGHIERNPCTLGGRLYSASRADKVWTKESEAAFLAEASPALSFAMLLALWTGQRQGDLLALTWAAYDGTHIRLRQQKTGVRVTVPVGAPLRAALEAASVGRAKGDRILLGPSGEPWRPTYFRTAWGRASRRAGISDLTFHDLRGTTVTNLFRAGCTEGEIATITGHSLRDVRSTLDANYFSRDVALADSGIAKLERSTGYTPHPLGPS